MHDQELNPFPSLSFLYLCQGHPSDYLSVPSTTLIKIYTPIKDFKSSLARSGFDKNKNKL